MIDTLWLLNLKKFLEGLLPKFIKDEEFCSKLVSEESMKVWRNAFTHESVDAADNYELLETVGDSVIGTAFIFVLVHTFPDKATSNFITEMKNYYMSKMPHGHYSKKLNLHMYTRVKTIKKIEVFNIYADVFESFIGALTLNSERIFHGSSLFLARNFLMWLFSTEKLDPKRGEGSPITIVQQLFSRFELPSLLEVKSESNKHKILKLSLHPDHLKFLRANGINIKNSLLSMKNGNTKKTVKAQVYEHAMEILEKSGITTKWAKEVKEKLDMEIPEVKKYYGKAMKRAVSNNIFKLRFFVPKKSITEGYILVQLEGVTADGVLKLESIVKEKSTNCYAEAKSELMRMYAMAK